jgi:hypothetical protein
MWRISFEVCPSVIDTPCIFFINIFFVHMPLTVFLFLMHIFKYLFLIDLHIIMLWFAYICSRITVTFYAFHVFSYFTVLRIVQNRQSGSSGDIDATESELLLAYKGKAIPLQAWTGHEGSRRLRPPYFKTIDTWSPTNRPHLTPRKCTWYSFLLKAESTPGP